MAATDKDGIITLQRSYPYEDYRGYPYLHRTARKRILEEELANRSHSNPTFVVEEGGVVRAFALSCDLPYETRIFSVLSRKLTYVMAVGSYHEAKSRYAKLLNRVLENARLCRVALLVCRIDCGDVAALHAFQEAGFQCMEVLHAYIWDCRWPPRKPTRKALVVREAKEEDLDAILQVANQAPLPGHYRQDPRLSSERVDQFYLEWVKNAVLRKAADTAGVAVADGRICGFISTLVCSGILEATGVRLATGSLAATRSPSTGGLLGVFPSLLGWIMEHHRESADIIECCTQAHNLGIIRTVERFGWRYMRARITFHRWL